MSALTFKQALRKGNPEFRSDQPRDESGKWTDGGGGGGSRASRELVDSFPIKGGSDAMRSQVRSALSKIPAAHVAKLKASGLTFSIVDVLSSIFRPGTMREGTFEEPWLFGSPSIVIASVVGGYGVLDSAAESTVLHELGHALDYASGWKYSRGEIGRILQDEWRAYHGGVDHGEYVSSPRELFAEMYMLVHGGTSRRYGGLTAELAQQAFPKSFAAVKNVRV